MKKKLKLNKKTIAELSEAQNVVGGGTIDCIPTNVIKCGTVVTATLCPTVGPPCESNGTPCLSNGVNCLQTQVCISDVECESAGAGCNDSVNVCIA